LLYNTPANNEDISAEAAVDALASVSGGELHGRMEQSIHTELAERGSTLSLGERQLISVARARAYNPQVLVLDEATSNIDSETEQLIQHAMKIVSRDRTTFIIAHRLSTVQHSDHIILLEDGRIAEQGDHAALMKAGGEYSRMYEMQVTGRPAGSIDLGLMLLLD